MQWQATRKKHKVQLVGSL